MIVDAFIGTNGEGTGSLGNTLGGIYLGPGTSSTRIGGNATVLHNLIFNSLTGPGVTVNGSSNDTLQGNQIGGNAGNGVTVVKARELKVGGSAPGAGNEIVANQGYGLEAAGVCSGSVVQSNLIAGNVKGNVNLSKSRGITYIP